MGGQSCRPQGTQKSFLVTTMKTQQTAASSATDEASFDDEVAPELEEHSDDKECTPLDIVSTPSG
jgi:hypothetical protein